MVSLSFVDENGLLPPSSNKLLTPADKKADIRSQLQMNRKALEHLRQIAKDCKKTLVLPKDEKSCDKQSQEAVENGISLPENERAELRNSGDDVIISSVGSSPANSPKPTDLVLLSTPPKESKPARTVLGGSRDEVDTPRKKLKLSDIIDNKVSPFESRKRKFDELVLNSHSVDTCAKKIGFDKKPNDKCNGNSSLMSSDPLKNTENPSGVYISNEVSKGEIAQTNSYSSSNKKKKEPVGSQLQKNSVEENLIRKNKEESEQQRTFHQSGDTGDFRKQAHEPSTNDGLIKDNKSNEFDKQKPVEKTCKDQSIDTTGLQNNVSSNEDKEKPGVSGGKHARQSLQKGEQSFVMKTDSVKNSFPKAEKQNKGSTKRTKTEVVSHLESSQQRNQSRRTRSEFNSYEFKEVGCFAFGWKLQYSELGSVAKISNC